MADTLSTFTSLAREALEEVRSAILIADARADDLPIIYMNPAFEELTGYSKNEVLGHNCRFLQGPETDRTAVRSVKQGIEEDRACTRNPAQLPQGRFALLQRAVHQPDTQCQRRDHPSGWMPECDRLSRTCRIAE
jgi:PAS domain S-box-containing protein